MVRGWAAVGRHCCTICFQDLSLVPRVLLPDATENKAMRPHPRCHLSDGTFAPWKPLTDCTRLESDVTQGQEAPGNHTQAHAQLASEDQNSTLSSLHAPHEPAGQGTGKGQDSKA
jgi:hypothetical protein